jgi:hypothetical protein
MGLVVYGEPAKVLLELIHRFIEAASASGRIIHPG